MERRSEPNRAPLWEKVLDRYRDELKSDEDYQIVSEVHSLEGFLDHTKSLQSQSSRYGYGLVSPIKLASMFKLLDDFSTLIALVFKPDPMLTAAIWGSLRLVLNLAFSPANVHQNMLAVLEDLCLTLPKCSIHEDTLPVNRQLEAALEDAYTEIICFYARTIYFLRCHPHPGSLSSVLWVDCDRTSTRIQRKSENHRYRELLDAVKSLGAKQGEDDKKLEYRYLPLLRNNRFSGRSVHIAKIEAALDGVQSDTSLQRSMALFGMGGIGKTQIALEYAHRSIEKYDVVLWVPADTPATIEQSCREIAQGLQLYQTLEDTQDEDKAAWKVKNWLDSTDISWLVVFDNVDDLQAVKVAWPGNPRGSILLTTRDFGVARSQAAAYLQLEPFDENEGCTMLLKQIGLDPAVRTHQQPGMEIARALGGLPLALSQIGGFIAQRRLALGDFLALYERNDIEINARKAREDDYEHTLSTVWNVSFERLPENSAKLLNIMIFLDPNLINEDIFLQKPRAGAGLDPAFGFLTDEMDLGDAEEALLKAALISKTIDRPILSMHLLVQSVAIHRLADSERTKCFDTMVQLLSWGFPDAGSRDLDLQFKQWRTFEKCLRHVVHLTKLVKRHSIHSSNSQLYAELLLWFSWYSYEGGKYDIARGLLSAAVKAFEDKTTLAYASALDLEGLISLDMYQPVNALVSFEKALDLRETRLGADAAAVAYTLNNMGLAFMEKGALDKADTAHRQAIHIRLIAKSDKVLTSFRNLASLYLRKGGLKEAAELLLDCCVYPPYAEESFVTKYRRLSSEMVLLWHILIEQGRADKKPHLVANAQASRQRLFRDGLKTCDSIDDTTPILYLQQHVASTIALLEEIVDITKELNKGKGQPPPLLSKLFALYLEKTRALKADISKAKAIEIRARLRPQGEEDPLKERTFSHLVPWMLHVECGKTDAVDPI